MINIQLEKKRELSCHAGTMKRLLILNTGNVKHAKEKIVYMYEHFQTMGL